MSIECRIYLCLSPILPKNGNIKCPGPTFCGAWERGGGVCGTRMHTQAKYIATLKVCHWFVTYSIFSTIFFDSYMAYTPRKKKYLLTWKKLQGLFFLYINVFIENKTKENVKEQEAILKFTLLPLKLVRIWASTQPDPEIFHWCRSGFSILFCCLKTFTLLTSISHKILLYYFIDNCFPVKLSKICHYGFVFLLDKML